MHLRLLWCESFRERESLSEGAEIESLSEGQERMAMATQIIVKQKLSGKQKSKWGSGEDGKSFREIKSLSEESFCTIESLCEESFRKI